MAGFLLLFQAPTSQLAHATVIQQRQWLPPHQPANGEGLTIQIRSSTTATVVGGVLHYTMTVANQTMMSATNVIAFTLLPTNTTYLSGTVTTQIISALITQTLQPGSYYDPQFNAIAWVGNLAPKATASVHFTVKVKEGNNCRNTIHSTANAQLTLWSAFITDTITVDLLCTGPDIELTHTSNVTSTTFHGVIEYQVRIRNHGLGAAENLVLLNSLPFPDETSYLIGSLTASQGQASYDAGQHAIRWTGAVPAQGDILITFAIQLTKFTSCKTLYSRAFLEGPALSTVLSAVAKVEYRCPRIEKLQFSIQSNLTATTPGSIVDYQLTITNPGDLPTDKIQIFSAIPVGAAYVPGSATATSGSFTYNPMGKELTWDSVLAEHSTVHLYFQLQIRERVQCGAVITTQATVFNTDLLTPSNPTVQTALTVACTESQPWTDFGDAPDSDSNHHGMNNTAYVASNVLGHFPTVWEGTPANEASGPTHRPDYFWLGDEISAEVDADLNLDAGAIAHGRDFTNILHNGQEDVADWEFEDDGWRNPSVPMLNCEKPTLLVRIRRADVPTPVERLWLNVWFDGNRDGDWQDSGDCPGSADPLGGKSFEWVVQDWVIYPDQIPPDGFLDLQIPTKLIYNPTPASLVWVRFTLSEQRALRPTIGSLADGRGPAHPAFFQVGETEDYLVDGLLQGEPVQVSLYHETDFVITPTVRIGNKVEFYTILEPTTGVAPATLVMQNNLPAEVTLVGYPAFNVLSRPDDYVGTDDGVTPLVATFLPNEGPSGRIEWRGQLRREVVIRISYTVEVRACPPPDANGQHPLRSVAQVRQPDGAIVSAEAAYLVDCTPTAVGAARLFLPLVNK